MVSTVHVVTAADPATSVLPLSRAAYDLLVERGQFDGARVELLEGVLVQMPPTSDRHARAIALLDRWLQKGLPDRFEVRAQLPFAASDHSEPEPDVAVTDFGPATGGHPSTAHLVVEVTLLTHHTDLVVKPRLYAAAGIPRYWVLDLRGDRLVEHTDPTGDGYDTVVVHGASAVLHVEGVAIRLTELLGPPPG
jgi:Uma2 family endonuclease